jgi:hypothetical protein
VSFVDVSLPLAQVCHDLGFTPEDMAGYMDVEPDLERFQRYLALQEAAIAQAARQ